jgi:uncharacterized protein (TIGR03083 family)
VSTPTRPGTSGAAQPYVPGRVHPARLSHEQACDLAEAELLRFAAAVRAADLNAPVPTCPGWTVADLGRHMGWVYRWAAQHVSEHSRTRVREADVKDGAPSEDAELAEWLADGVAPAVGTFRRAAADEAVWAWGADRRAAFWPRRMLHEATIHRADVEIASGIEPEIAAGVACDGIDELLDNLPHAVRFAPRVAELRGGGGSLHLHTTDSGGEWAIRLQPDGFCWEHEHCKADVAVKGPAGALLLFLYGRRALADGALEVFGERELLERFVSNAAL